MVIEGTKFRCQNCTTEVEIISVQNFGGPLVCCEVEMKKAGDEFEALWEAEAYDEMDSDWN